MVPEMALEALTVGFRVPLQIPKVLSRVHSLVDDIWYPLLRFLPWGLTMIRISEDGMICILVPLVLSYLDEY